MNYKSQVVEGNRVGLYVDGFNLYYQLCGLEDNSLKWLNLRQLGERICQDRQHNLVNTTYCSAFRKNDIEAKSRHEKYIEALEATGVKVELGHYVTGSSEPCSACGTVDNKDNEKQSDINMALSAYSDVANDLVDWVYLLSADSDQAATAFFIRRAFPEKGIITVVPPNQVVSQKTVNHCNGKRLLNRDDIEKCRFPSIIRNPEDQSFIRCPREYDIENP
ncbi:NYN domain-containing protein [Amylibacter sp. IMCC11727]|uniref:NYN domain-containing protein n=1 Tax=Amylibacter sp. IMCC11727 TaxID=3039851 RepID=UPI00244DB89C|nr:NYN domain-containing protein [Amylibacter sp. IMCC11727]WGI21591.1 NYN domain-containing protein [Amylibacter sp. IMCC11727]